MGIVWLRFSEPNYTLSMVWRWRGDMVGLSQDDCRSFKSTHTWNLQSPLTQGDRVQASNISQRSPLQGKGVVIFKH